METAANRLIHPLRALIALMSLLIAAACATTETVESRDLQAGLSRVFDAPAAEVVSVARSVLDAQGLDITGADPIDGHATLTFSKPISAFSWGEVGRLVFVGLGPNRTQVFITTERRGTLNITAKSQASFASDIFSALESALAGGQ